MNDMKHVKSIYEEYWADEGGLKQGEYKMWWADGKMHTHCLYRDNKLHGEFKTWHWDGNIEQHVFKQNGKTVVDFIKNHGLYPETGEGKLIFALRYGSGEFLPTEVDGND